MPRSIFARQVSHTFLMTALNLVLGVSSSLLLAKWLGASERGDLAVLQQTLFLLGFFFLFGMDISFVRFASRGDSASSVLLGNALFTTVLCGLLGFFAYLFFGALTRDLFYEGIDFRWILLAALLLPLFLNQQIQAALLRGWERIVWVNRLSTLFIAIDLGMIVLLWIGGRLNAGTALWAQGVALGAAGLFLLALSYSAAESSWPRISWPLLKEQTGYGGKTYLNGVLQLLCYRLDIYLVAFFLTDESVGRYIVAVAIAEMIWRIPEAVAFVLFPKVGAGVSARTPAQTGQLVRVLTAVMIPLSLGVALAGSVVIRWLGESYGVASAEALWVLLPGILFYSIAKLIYTDLAGRGAPEKATSAFAVGLAVTVVLDLLFIPILGINGAALATSAAYIVVTLLLLHIFVTEHALDQRDFFRLRRQDFRSSRGAS